MPCPFATISPSLKVAPHPALLRRLGRSSRSLPPFIGPATPSKPPFTSYLTSILTTTSMPRRSDLRPRPGPFDRWFAPRWKLSWTVVGFMGVSLGSDVLHAITNICSLFPVKQEISARAARLSAPYCLPKNSKRKSYIPCRIDTTCFPSPRCFGAFSNANGPCFPFSRKPPIRASSKASRSFSTAKMSGLAR